MLLNEKFLNGRLHLMVNNNRSQLKLKCNNLASKISWRIFCEQIVVENPNSSAFIISWIILNSDDEMRGDQMMIKWGVIRWWWNEGWSDDDQMRGDQGGIWAINSHSRWGNVTGFTIFHSGRHFSLDFSILIGSISIKYFHPWRHFSFYWVEYLVYLLVVVVMSGRVGSFL